MVLTLICIIRNPEWFVGKIKLRKRGKLSMIYINKNNLYTLFFRENAIQSNFEQTQNDMQKLNNQLIAAVQQKLVLSEQLEQWQV